MMSMLAYVFLQKWENNAIISLRSIYILKNGIMFGFLMLQYNNLYQRLISSYWFSDFASYIES